MNTKIKELIEAIQQDALDGDYFMLDIHLLELIREAKNEIHND